MIDGRAEGRDCRDPLRILQREANGAVSPRRNSSEKTALARRKRAIATLDLGNEVGPERGLHLGRAAVNPPAALASRHDDNGRWHGTAADELVNLVLNAGAIGPGILRVAGTVQQIDDGILPPTGSVAIGQIHEQWQVTVERVRKDGIAARGRTQR